MSASPSHETTLSPEERRDHGVHYTPEAMAAEVVTHTLDRLFVEHAATSNFIRSLRVGDMAAGGGVFLIETVRYLAEKLVAAWEREGVTGTAREDWPALARHVVAEQCIFGVERDPDAAAKAREAVAAFVGATVPVLGLDHMIREGDALVGLSLVQLAALDWVEPKGDGLLSPWYAEVLAANSTDSILAADVVLSAFFAHGKPAARRKELSLRREIVLKALRGDADARERAEAWQEELLERVQPFHWWLEFPSLFSSHASVPSRVDAFVGNPPFVGGGKISSVHGNAYLDWLREAYPGAGGRCDLCAYFFRRAWDVMGRGAMGLIATNTISQGDTREGGLHFIVADGGRIFRAHVNERWPGDASVCVSTVFLSKFALAPDAPSTLRGGR
jgi:hypothetical protein